jgi:ferredoxin
MNKIKVTMRFSANDITVPVTYHLVKDYDLMVNILNADISLNKIGTLVVDLSGEEENIKKGLEYIRSLGVEVKIFNKNIIWKADECIHCGACTAVCPSGALAMDKTDWSLTFDREKCLICGLCVKACPINVMNITDNGE